MKQFCLACRQSGFTLVELLIVITITGLIAAFGISTFINYNQKQQLDNATQDVASALAQTKSMANSSATKNLSSCPSGDTSYAAFSLTITGQTYAIKAVCGTGIGPGDSVDYSNPITVPPTGNITGNAVIGVNPVGPLYFYLPYYQSKYGVVSNPTTFTIKRSGPQETVTVDSSGVIRVN